MKRLFMALTLVAIFAAASFAGVQDFGKFTIDVPEGWTAEQDGETVGIVKNDNSAAVSISVDTLDGDSLKDFADAFVKELNGKDLQFEDGAYKFVFSNANGVESKAVLSCDDKNYALFVITGAENAPDDIVKMMDSIVEK